MIEKRQYKSLIVMDMKNSKFSEFRVEMCEWRLLELDLFIWNYYSLLINFTESGRRGFIE